VEYLTSQTLDPTHPTQLVPVSQVRVEAQLSLNHFAWFMISNTGPGVSTPQKCIVLIDLETVQILRLWNADGVELTNQDFSTFSSSLEGALSLQTNIELERHAISMIENPPPNVP